MPCPTPAARGLTSPLTPHLDLQRTRTSIKTQVGPSGSSSTLRGEATPSPNTRYLRRVHVIVFNVEEPLPADIVVSLRLGIFPVSSAMNHGQQPAGDLRRVRVPHCLELGEEHDCMRRSVSPDPFNVYLQPSIQVRRPRTKRSHRLDCNETFEGPRDHIVWIAVGDVKPEWSPWVGQGDRNGGKDVYS